MSAHAPPMNDQMKTWMTTCSTYCRIPPMGTRGTSASTTRAARRAISVAPDQDTARTNEHHHDEEGEGHHVPHLGGPGHATDGDDLAHDEGGHEGPHHVPETAQHADHEGERTEGRPEIGMHRVLDDEQGAGHARHGAAHGRGDQV